MSQQKQSHKIKVVAMFDGGQIRPVIFKWNNANHKIKTVNLAYQEREGQSMNYYFSVEDDNGGVFKLRYNDQKLLWWLDEYWAE